MAAAAGNNQNLFPVFFEKSCFRKKNFKSHCLEFFFFLTKLGSKQQVSANFRVKFFQQQKRQFSCINYTLEWISLGRRRNESRLRKRKKKNKSWRDNNQKLFKKLLLSLFFLPWSFSDCNYPSIEVLKEHFLRTLEFIEIRGRFFKQTKFCIAKAGRKSLATWE